MMLARVRSWWLGAVLAVVTAGAAQTPVLLQGGRALLPVRAVAEFLGATLDYDQATGETSLALNRRFLILKPYRALATLDGRNVKAEPAPLAVAGLTWAPARLLAEGLGVRIDWEEARAVVRVYDAAGQALELPVTSQIETLTASFTGAATPETAYHLALLDQPGGTDPGLEPKARLWVVRGGKVLWEFEPAGANQVLARDGGPVRRPLLARDLTKDGRQTLVARFGAAGQRTELYLLAWDRHAATFNNLLGTGAEHFTLTPHGDLTVSDNGPKKPVSLLIYDAYPEQSVPKDGFVWYSAWLGLSDGKFRPTLSHTTEERYREAKPALAAMGITLGGK